MSDKVYPVQITYKSRTWDYTDAQATGLRACSDLVSAEVDTRVESDEDNMEPICIPIADGDYTEDHVNDCLEYYSKNEWKPAMYGKVVSNTVADIVQDQAGQDLCTKYGVEEMNNLYKVATYLQMKNLQNLALIRLGVEVYCRPDDLNAFNVLQTKNHNQGTEAQTNQNNLVIAFKEHVPQDQDAKQNENNDLLNKRERKSNVSVMSDFSQTKKKKAKVTDAAMGDPKKTGCCCN